MKAEPTNRLGGALAGPAASEHERLIEGFLRSIEGMSLREAEERTGVSDATIGHLRRARGRPSVVRKATEEKMVAHLRSRGLWPAPPSPSEISGARGGRPEIAFRHFTSPALMRFFGWSPAQVVSALFLYADEEAFSPAEISELGELTGAYLRMAQEEAQ